MRLCLASALSFLVAVPAFAAPTAWEIDPSHSSASFSVKHMGVSTVRGSLGGVKGTVTLDDKSPTATKIEATIDVNTIDTKQAKRDGHLKSPDFFDAGKHPTITFKSTSVTAAGADKYTVVGDLTMHGETHPATLAVTASPAAKGMMPGTLVRGFEATTTLDRTVWGLKWNKPLEAGAGMLVGNDVAVIINGEMDTKAPGKPAAATPKTK